MQENLLPLFPLPLVLFPRTPLPLHIFEERYKEMVGDALRERTEFGIVLAREKGIVNAGCTAAVERVLHRYPDGRLDILTAGRRRFEILLLNQEMPYLRAAVEFFDDDDPEAAPAELRSRALEAYSVLVGLAGDEAPEPNFEDPQLSFQLAQIVEDADFRQQLLRLRSEAERMTVLLEFCRQYIPKRRLIANLKRVQPLNGHSRFHLPPAGHA
jgi:Lon protease-like protein